MGFFDRHTNSTYIRKDGKLLSCISCGLWKDCVHPKIEPYGDFRKEIMIIGEAPGEEEDRKGRPWQGKTGRLLQFTLRQLDVDLFHDCVCINAVRCRPKDARFNRAPTNYEMDCCRQYVFEYINRYKPKVIILLGNAAIYSVIGHRLFTKNIGGINKWRGWTIPDQDVKAWVCPTYHPSYITREEGKEIRTIWRADLKKAIDKAKDPFPIQKKVVINVEQDLSFLDEIRSKKQTIAFDYETTGIKPHAPGHQIVCVGVSSKIDSAHVFMLPKTRKGRQKWLDTLEDRNVLKIAQNAKFEHSWGKVRLRQETNGWVWDTMLASHILDNRPGITGLKFQVYVQFGVTDYSSEIAKYLQSSIKGSNSINNIQKLIERVGGKELLMKYCALDAAYEFKLAMKQIKEIGYEYL